MIRKFINRYRKWKDWRKVNGLTKFEQVLVLLGLKRCLHFNQFMDWRNFETKNGG